MGRTVSIIPAGAPAVTIYDGNKSPRPDRCPEGFRPKRAREFQIAALFRSAFKAGFDRYNVTISWDFTVWHCFATYEACQDFAGSRGATLPGSGELVILNSSSQGSFTRYYKTAFITACECSLDLGLVCQFRYSILSTAAYSVTP